MALKSLTYREFENDPRCWSLERCEFSQINLVVGRNATGKTRVTNVIDGLCKILSGRNTTVFESGTYEVEIVLSGKVYTLYWEVAGNRVVKESLDVDGINRLTRGADGSGQIYYEKRDEFIEFQVEPSVIAIQQRRDELQHPFVTELSRWAAGCQTYAFGTSLGREVLVSLATLQASQTQPEKNDDPNDLVHVYTKAFEKYREEFDQAILRDMRSLGYELADVGTEDMRRIMSGLIAPEPILGMFVLESDRDAPLPQLYMSQGMYRALAMIIHINAASFGKVRTMVLVDDIGEGLDYERSSGLIDVLIRHAQQSTLQLIMTSNDRFVMNRIPLEYWLLLQRDHSVVRAYSERNRPEEFDSFKYMGLSNFDFFTSAKFH